jgi:tRNA U55 pseudouridine synthase TruB
MHKMNLIGTVKELQRTSSGNFSLDDAVDLDALQDEDMTSIYDSLLKSKYPLIMPTKSFLLSMIKKKSWPLTKEQHKDFMFVRADCENQMPTQL